MRTGIVMLVILVMAGTTIAQEPGSSAVLDPAQDCLDCSATRWREARC